MLPPVKPMLAKSVPDVPEGEYLYEPKWDGFCCCSSSCLTLSGVVSARCSCPRRCGASATCPSISDHQPCETRYMGAPPTAAG